MLDAMTRKRKIKDINKTAINSVFAVMILCISVLGGYSVYQARELNQHTEDIYSHPFIVSNALRDIAIQIISIRSNMQDIPFAKGREIDAIVTDIQQKDAKTMAEFDVVLGAFLGDKKEIEKTRDLFIQWREIRNNIIAVAKSSDRERAYAQIHGFGLAHVTKLRSRIASHIQFANAKAQQFRAASSRRESDMIMISIFLSILIFATSIMSFIFILRQHKRHEQAVNRYIEDLKRSEDKFREILDAAPDALLVVDHSGAINISNIGAQHVFGFSKDELEGQRIDMLIPAHFRHGHGTLFAGYFESPRVRSMLDGRRLEALHKAGHTFPVTISLSPVKLDGETYVTCNIRDMSGYEQLEENFRQAQKMESIGTLVGGIAHDFNNILAAISGAVFLAKRQFGDNKHLVSIESQSHRAADIVKQLLAFARKDIKKMEAMDLCALVAESSNLFKLSASENIQFNLDICREKLLVQGDFTQLQQVILNLVNNARDAMVNSTTPVITVALQAGVLPDRLTEKHPDLSARRLARISISDNGHGIEQKHIHEIFEPFFTRKEVGKGTGLGLAMAKGTIESHGGLIDVESQVGEGTTFSIFLPLLDANMDAAVPADAGAVAIEAASGECILLADDEAALREVNREILETLGYQVEEAADGLEAVRKFNEFQDMVTLIIMDVVMPRMGGVKAAEQIRQLSDSVPIIFATGYDRSQVLGEHDSELSNCSVVTKPFTVSELHDAIKKMI